MYGPNVKTLSLYVAGDSNLGPPVWTRSGTLGNKWLSGRVNIIMGSTTKQFEVTANYRKNRLSGKVRIKGYIVSIDCSLP